MKNRITVSPNEAITELQKQLAQSTNWFKRQRLRKRIKFWESQLKNDKPSVAKKESK